MNLNIEADMTDMKEEYQTKYWTVNKSLRKVKSEEDAERH